MGGGGRGGEGEGEGRGKGRGGGRRFGFILRTVAAVVSVKKCSMLEYRIVL